MSKRRGFREISLPLSAALDWCKKIAGRYWRAVGGLVRSVTNGRRNDGFRVARRTNVMPPIKIDFCGEWIELNDFIKLLCIGDRVRVLCDDGLLVAEKISQTQFKLIHSQMMSKSVH